MCKNVAPLAEENQRLFESDYSTDADRDDPCVLHAAVLRGLHQQLITGEAPRAITGHRGNDALRGDLPDAEVAGVRAEQIACPVHRHAPRMDLRAGSGPYCICACI